MAKVTRGDLKGIIKECLIEILAEGLLADNSTQMLETTPRRKKKRSSPKQRQRPQVEHEQVIQEAVAGLTDDPMMADIFNDTARGTLQEQLSAENMGGSVAGGDFASQQASMADPDDLFGDASEKWAALAFSEAGSNKSPTSD